MGIRQRILMFKLVI